MQINFCYQQKHSMWRVKHRPVFHCSTDGIDPSYHDSHTNKTSSLQGCSRCWCGCCIPQAASLANEFFPLKKYNRHPIVHPSWWGHGMKMLSTLLALCVGNPLWLVDSPHKGLVMWSLDLSFVVVSLTCCWINRWTVWDLTCNTHNEADMMSLYCT